MNLLESNLIEYSLTKKNPIRVGNHDNAISPFGVYKAKDAFIVIAAGNENIWRVFADFLKKYSSFDESLFSSNILRLKNSKALTEIIEKVFAAYSVAELEELLSKLSIPCSKVNEMADVASDEENFSRKALVHVQHSKLGECVVPGSCITFSEVTSTDLDEAPAIGEDNKQYGI
jgi:crotonobetainyl-CoA:carnitine CoA-transferase CaiB-like acyl-CoA transferase